MTFLAGTTHLLLVFCRVISLPAAAVHPPSADENKGSCCPQIVEREEITF
jgi:hypothetical protein